MRPVQIPIRLRECSGWSESPLGIYIRKYIFWRCGLYGFVCLFVLKFYGPVNPMWSCRARSVYLTTRLLGRRLTSIVHILSPETDNCPSWISGRERMTVALRKHAYSNILKILPPKNENVQIKFFDIFHISAQNIDCMYPLEPPWRGGSNEYPQSMFWAEIWKIMYTPVNPSFTI